MKFNELKQYRNKKVEVYSNGHCFSGTLIVLFNNRKIVKIKSFLEGTFTTIVTGSIDAVKEIKPFIYDEVAPPGEAAAIVDTMVQKAAEEIQKIEDEAIFKELDKTIEDINKKYVNNTYPYTYPYIYNPDYNWNKNQLIQTPLAPYSQTLPLPFTYNIPYTSPLGQSYTGPTGIVANQNWTLNNIQSADIDCTVAANQINNTGTFNFTDANAPVNTTYTIPANTTFSFGAIGGFGQYGNTSLSFSDGYGF